MVGATVQFRPAYADPVNCTVVGVAPEGPGSIEKHSPQVWISASAEKHFKNAMQVNFRMIGRLAAGVGRRQAEAALDVAAFAIATKHGGNVIPGYENEGIFRSGLRTELRHAGLGSWGAFRPLAPVRQARLLALGVSGLVLLIACANIANLLLARAERRRKETAIRLSVGASRGRILRAALVESLLLSMLGGAGGLLLAHFGNRLLIALRPDNVEMLVRTNLDWRVAGFTFFVVLLATLFIGFLPAWRCSQQDPNDALKNRQSAPQSSAFRLRDGFAMVQIALSLILLISTGLCLKSFEGLLASDPGFNTTELVAAPVEFQNVTEAGAPAHYRDLVQRLTANPGIESVSWTRTFPILPMQSSISAPVDGIEGYEPKRDEFLTVEFTQIGPNFFETMGMAVAVSPGRSLGSQGDMVWVNEAFVRRYWPGQNPVGRRVGPWIVDGVVKDTQVKNLWDPPSPFLYQQMAEPDSRSGVLMVRATGNPVNLLRTLRSELLALDPELDVSRLMTMRQALGETLNAQRFIVVLLGVFAASAMLLCVIGIYGVMSYLVTQRTREIGIRLALGAQRSRVVNGVLRHGVRLTSAGVAIGLFGSWSATRMLAGLLVGVSPTDPVTFVIVSAIFAIASLLACWLLARRAAKVDPIVALRNE